MSNPIPVILDVDTGVDDALAILLAVRHPALDVRAISCVAGNVSLEQVVTNTLGLLTLLGREDVPVAAGMRRPMLGVPRDASYIHGENGVGDIDLPEPGIRAVDAHAVVLLRDVIMSAEHEITIIALAPMTNIATLLLMYPEVVPRIERIIFMGGAVGQGNASASAEFNIWHDPEAADIVLRSGVPLTMYGLEPFYKVACTAEEITQLRAASSPVTSTAGALLSYLAQTTVTESRVEEMCGAAIGDAGAVCAAILPHSTHTRRAPVAVSLLDPLTRGRTVVDFRTGLGAGGTHTSHAECTVEVVTGVDAKRYIDIFKGALA